MKWQEVIEKHGRQGAVSSAKSRLKSLAFSLDKRRPRTNKVVGKDLHFYLPPNCRERDLEAIKSAVKNQIAVPVYRKISPDNWEDAGYHAIVRVFEGEDPLGRESVAFVASPVE